MLAKMFGRIFKPATPFGSCPDCNATILQRCAFACPNIPNRSANAPVCHDGLHHHCAHMPFCVDGCKNDQRTIKEGSAMPKNHSHINAAGQFQSDKYPELAPDKIVLSFNDPAAQSALWVFADRTKDQQLAVDIAKRLQSIKAKG